MQAQRGEVSGLRHTGQSRHAGIEGQAHSSPLGVAWLAPHSHFECPIVQAARWQPARPGPVHSKLTTVLMAGLQERAAHSGTLLERCSRVITDLQVSQQSRAVEVSPPPPAPPRHNRLPTLLTLAQVDVGGLLWEIDRRQGSSFHEEVAGSLPSILAAAQDASGRGTGEGTGDSGRASPEDAGRQLLLAAEDRVGLLQRAYNTITGLQVGPC